MNQRKKLNKIKTLRKKRTRTKIKSASKRLRLSIFKSNKYIYAQLIDDTTQKTLASSSSKTLKEKAKNVETAKKIGQEIGEKAKKIGIKNITLDKGHYTYHGCVKALAEGARETGLNF